MSATGNVSAAGAHHQPVMVSEVMELLDVSPGGRYVDATLGLGGHARALLDRSRPDGVVVGLDRDEQAAAEAERRLLTSAGVRRDRFIVRRCRFSRLDEALSELGWRPGSVDGLLADLGVSSYQLDREARGFGFDSRSELDMRMESTGPTARDMIERWSVDELADVLRRFGEERLARRYARAIKKASDEGRLETGRDLASVVESAAGPAWVARARRNVATKVFMALRIAVNDELSELESLLRQGPRWLRGGGRMAVISFHSLEDRAVKRAFKELARPQADVPPGLPLRASEMPQPEFRLVTGKPVRPSATEQSENPRSRSARLRVLERRAA